MQMLGLECPLVLHDCQDHKELEDLLREMSELLQTLYQVGEDLHWVVYQDSFEVCLPLLRNNLLRSLLSGPRLVPEIAVVIAARQKEE